MVSSGNMASTQSAAVVNLATELSDFQTNFVKGVPEEVVNTFMAKTQELAKSGIVESAVKVGDKAPLFTLPDANGTEVAIQDLLQKGPVVLTFYRGAWCPYCNLALRAMQKVLPDIEVKGATLVAVSPELPEYIQGIVEEKNLTFPVLSDVGMKVGKRYGLSFVLDPKLQKMYTEFGLDVNAHNGDKTFQLPLPATYVIGQDGIVKYAFVNADYTKRAEPSEILKSL